jgi:hypothetical protein
MLTIYGHPASRASRPYWLLREYGLKVGMDFLEGGCWVSQYT